MLEVVDHVEHDECLDDAVFGGHRRSAAQRGRFVRMFRHAQRGYRSGMSNPEDTRARRARPGRRVSAASRGRCGRAGSRRRTHRLGRHRRAAARLGRPARLRLLGRRHQRRPRRVAARRRRPGVRAGAPRGGRGLHGGRPCEVHRRRRRRASPPRGPARPPAQRPLRRQARQPARGRASSASSSGRRSAPTTSRRSTSRRSSSDVAPECARDGDDRRAGAELLDRAFRTALATRSPLRRHPSARRPATPRAGPRRTSTA